MWWCVLVIIASTVYATYRGFVSETLSIFAWVAAAFATLYFGPWLAHLMREMISPRLARRGRSATRAVFLVVVIPLSFMSFRFSEDVKKSPGRRARPRAGRRLRRGARAGDHRHRLSGFLRRRSDPEPARLDHQGPTPAADPEHRRRSSLRLSRISTWRRLAKDPTKSAVIHEKAAANGAVAAAKPADRKTSQEDLWRQGSSRARQAHRNNG